MKNESNMQVTFSKRRASLFKKASELCTLCGAEIAIVVFSAGKTNKVYSFGHPSVELLVDTFLARDLPPPNDDDRHNHLIRAHRNTGQRGLNKEVMDMQESLQKEKAIGKSLLESGRGAYDRVCESPIIEGLRLSQLEQLKESLEGQKRKVEFEAKLQEIGSSPLPFLTFGSALSPTSGDGASSSHGPNVGAPFPN
ncbi:MADS-box transcription factor 47 [Capsicum baccatum]|uniref:MADS-box transcription factor 47 n=1 Tax=Capsicum baccatum TaxID=33114 RepID=A0A2G2V8Q1_CAPBA|nr:MADS-box transcription factor 47 [Capsicum baccatum]